MGSKGSGVSSPPSAVCCMCGDLGLSQQLFRCKICLFRSQHKYCSDLYPKAETYRTCNWCLREEEGKSSAAAREPATIDHNNPTSPSTNSAGGAMGGGKLLHRGAFSSHLNTPIKKQRVSDTPTPPAPEVIRRLGSAEISPRSKGRQELNLRGKVRRYKLLEEVSS